MDNANVTRKEVFTFVLTDPYGVEYEEKLMTPDGAIKANGLRADTKAWWPKNTTWAALGK